MKKHLHIELTGPAPELGGGEAEGVSLKFFAQLARQLREAYQRAAQGVLTGKIQDEGRLPDRAREVDIRLVNASEGSLNLDLAPADLHVTAILPLPHTQPDSLAEDSLDKLMDILESARRSSDSPDIPKAFRALVGGMSADIRQRYTLVRGSDVLREVILSSSGLETPAEEPVLAGIRRVAAKVRGLTFSPQTSVLLEIGKSPQRAIASMAVVKSAMDQHDRADLIATLVTTSSGVRLVHLAPASVEFPIRSPDVRETLSRFADVMKILAQ